mgnify:CR=1 FL=1|jgi:hypothetical protein
MAFRISLDMKNALCSDVVKYLAGTYGTAGTASLTIRAGSQPGSADSSGTGATLCVISGIGWGTDSVATTSGTALLYGTFSGTAGTSGTAEWARLECINASGTCRIDGDVGTSVTNVFTINVNSFSSGGEINLLSANIYMA